MATIEDFQNAASEMDDVDITPLTMEDVYNIYGVGPSKNEDGDNNIE